MELDQRTKGNTNSESPAKILKNSWTKTSALRRWNWIKEQRETQIRNHQQKS